MTLPAASQTPLKWSLHFDFLLVHAFSLVILGADTFVAAGHGIVERSVIQQVLTYSRVQAELRLDNGNACGVWQPFVDVLAQVKVFSR